jgi:hypothetical protein
VGAAGALPAVGIVGAALGKPRAPVPHPPVPPVLSGRDQASPTPFNDFASAQRHSDAARIQCDYGNRMVVDTANPKQRAPATCAASTRWGARCSIRLAQFEAFARICRACIVR